MPYIKPEMKNTMTRAVLSLAALAVLAACSKAPEAPAPSAAPDQANQPAATQPAPGSPAQAAATPVPAPASGAPVLSFEGYGPVRFGAQLAEVEKQLGVKSQPLGAADPACSMVRLPGIEGVRFMVEQGRITRADADAGTANSLGLKTGDTLDAAKKKAPTLQVGPHKYLPEGHYLTANSADGKAAIIMEEDGKSITKIRAGMQPAVAYVETCL